MATRVTCSITDWRWVRDLNPEYYQSFSSNTSPIDKWPPIKNSEKASQIQLTKETHTNIISSHLFGDNYWGFQSVPILLYTLREVPHLCLPKYPRRGALLQCSRKTFMVHQPFVRWTLYILFKFVKSLIRKLGLAIGNVRERERD